MPNRAYFGPTATLWVGTPPSWSRVPFSEFRGCLFSLTPPGRMVSGPRVSRGTLPCAKWVEVSAYAFVDSIVLIGSLFALR